MTMRGLFTGVFVFLAAVGLASACPFCEAPTLTLTEQLNQADVAALVQWVESTPANRDKGFPGDTKYEVVEIVHDATGKLKPGEPIRLDRDRAGRKGDLFVLLGTKGTTVEWSSPLEVSETSYNYMKQAPTQETAPSERLAYFLKFLEYPDTLIANDAYGEFANAAYKDVVPLAGKLPREKLRKWLTDPQTPQTRLGLYGMMLGLCGKPEDAELMRRKILESTQDFRLGIDGIMGGYLLLTGNEGLSLIDDAKLKNREIPFSETYAAMQALRFMWTYAEGTISKDRLRQSMRILLERPELADLVITDLARWEDWSVADRLMQLYDADEYNIPSIKRAIVRFFLVAERAKPKDAAGPLPEHVLKAQRYLAELKQNDPKTVQAAERFFFIN
jgi:hypothetical protein